MGSITDKPMEEILRFLEESAFLELAFGICCEVETLVRNERSEVEVRESVDVENTWRYAHLIDPAGLIRLMCS